MAKTSARGATVVARVKRILRSQGGTRITLHRVLCSDGRILQRSDYLDPDGWKHRTGHVGIGKTIAVKDSWLVAQLINGWEREWEARMKTPRFGLKEHQVFWNEQGAVVCACCHVPYPGSDAWVAEHWREVTPEDAQEAARRGWRMACEGCGREPSRIVRLNVD